MAGLPLFADVAIRCAVIARNIVHSEIGYVRLALGEHIHACLVFLSICVAFSKQETVWWPN